MKQIILISGAQGSGKTSTQNEIIRRLSGKRSCQVINFADVIYEMHDRTLDVLHKFIPRRELVKDGPLLQLLGTEWGRKTIDENIWVRIAQEKYRQIQLEDCVVIVGDCRFENEFDAFPEALRIRLECPEKVRKERCSMWRENTKHPSEISLDEYARQGKFDLYIDTSKVTCENATTLIMAQIDKNSWLEKRERKEKQDGITKGQEDQSQEEHPGSKAHPQKRGSPSSER